MFRGSILFMLIRLVDGRVRELPYVTAQKLITSGKAQAYVSAGPRETK